jgi:hypothetical protein
MNARGRTPVGRRRRGTGSAAGLGPAGREPPWDRMPQSCEGQRHASIGMDGVHFFWHQT